MSSNNRTYLSDLPDLEDLESGGGGYNGNNKGGYANVGQPERQEYQQPSGPDNYKKFIRNTQGHAPPESGMGNMSNMGNGMQGPQQAPPPEFFEQPQHVMTNGPNCMDIHSHVQNCPICSRFFKNDSSIYIIAITVLAIVCILLLKRVLNL
jgi:hypothetical protein